MDKKQKAKFNILTVLMSVVLVMALFSVGFTVTVNNKLEGMEEGLTIEQVKSVVSDEVSSIEIPTDSGEQVSAEEVANMVISKMGETDSYKIEKVFEKLYSERIDNIENNALSVYSDEYSEEDLADFLEGKISNFDVLRDVELDSEDTEVEVLNLGLEDNEEIEASVVKFYDVEYENTESEEDLKERVKVTADVTYDEEDGYEADLNYSL